MRLKGRDLLRDGVCKDAFAEAEAALNKRAGKEPHKGDAASSLDAYVEVDQARCVPGGGGGAGLRQVFAPFAPAPVQRLPSTASLGGESSLLIMEDDCDGADWTATTATATTTTHAARCARMSFWPWPRPSRSSTTMMPWSYSRRHFLGPAPASSRSA